MNSSPSDLVKGFEGCWLLIKFPKCLSDCVDGVSRTLRVGLTLYLHSRGGVDVARASVRTERVLHILLRHQIKTGLCWWGWSALCVDCLYSHSRVGVDVARASLRVERVLHILRRRQIRPSGVDGVSRTRCVDLTLYLH